MTTTQTQKELPDSIVLRKAYNDADSTMRKNLQSVQTSYRAILEIKELHPVPPNLAEISNTWLNQIIDEKKTLISEDASLTEDERQTRLKAWSQVRMKALKPVSTIEGILKSWPDATWVYDEDINNYYCSNLEQVVAASSTFHVPLEAKEHLHLINQAIEQVRILRQWEDLHDVKSIALAHLQELPIEQFIEGWAEGAMKFDRRFAKYGINPQNYKDPNRPDRVII